MSETIAPISEGRSPSGDGVQKVYRFPNGYGASVIQTAHSYGGAAGLWEVGVIAFEGNAWSLTYDTPVTDDVIGYLDWPTVEATLAAIRDLPARDAS